MVIELAPGIKFIRSMKAGFPYCNAIYVDDEVKAVIDTGVGEEAWARAGVEPHKVDLVINTHYHRDHTIGNPLFTNARILVHPLDYPPMVDAQSRDYYTGFFEWERVMGYSRFSLTDPEKKAPPFQPSRVDGFINDGEVIHFGSTKAAVIHTPGHTPGHCAFFFEKEGILVGGDVDLTAWGPWCGDFLSNLDDFERSIEKLRGLEARIYCSAHRKPVREGIGEKLVNYAAKIREMEEKILKRLLRPVKVEELARECLYFRKHDHPYQFFWERRMVLKHLERLVKRGKVKVVEDEFYVLADG